jgi:putative SOS response-associated peptidase YedK
MPVILERADYQRWLEPFNDKTAELTKLLRSAPDDALTMYAVGSLVNSSRIDDPKCVKPQKGPAEPREAGLWDD